MRATRAILVDVTKCMGCRACEQACKLAHGLPEHSESRFSTTAYTVVEDHGDRYVRWALWLTG